MLLGFQTSVLRLELFTCIHVDRSNAIPISSALSDVPSSLDSKAKTLEYLGLAGL